MPIGAELLELLACPVSECRGRLRQGPRGLVCLGCGRCYPIEESWPVLIPEEAILPAAAAGDAASPDGGEAGR
jgi:uncharacterized protein YbaR (Trm112 family)